MMTPESPRAAASASPTRSEQPPGPPPRKGLLEDALFYARFATDPIGFVRKRFETYGDIYRVPTKDVPLYVTRHPDHAHEVLVSRAAHYDKQHSAFKQLSTVLGSGLLTSDGDHWARHRRMMHPVFARSRLAGYADVMVGETSTELASWKHDTYRDLGRDMTELTLRIVSTTLFSHDASGDATRTRTAMASIHDVLGGAPIPEWVPWPGRKRVAESIALLDDLIFSMIARRRERGPREGASDLLDLLLAAKDTDGDGAGLSDREIRDELLTLFLAGHETTAHALTWTFILLAQNPDAERALHEELDRVLDGRAPTFEDAERLPYTLQVIKESMRLYPPAYTLARRAIADTQVGGYDIPKGSEVVVWLYMTHHDARWYPEPWRFRPQRFDKEAEARLPKLAYLPFGAGGRACIGRAFALLEAQLVLATLAQRYRLHLVRSGRVEPKLRITMFPKRRVVVRLEARRL